MAATLRRSVVCVRWAQCTYDFYSGPTQQKRIVRYVHKNADVIIAF